MVSEPKKLTDTTRQYLKCKKYKYLKMDLLDQLERNGTVGEQYKDLVLDYLDLWETKCLLVDDIQARELLLYITMVAAKLNGKKFEVEGYIKDGKTYIDVNNQDIPLREVAEAIGLKVNWNGSTQTVVLNC